MKQNVADQSPIQWKTDAFGRVPYQAYTSAQLHERELERLFYADHWCYVGLSCEIPNPGDFKTTFVGERAVVLVRDLQGEVRVVENHCAHRGVRFCQQATGNAKEFVCPYHQWNYNLQGDLVGLPFRRGVRATRDGEKVIQGGMPDDFKLEDHGLNKLQVAEHHGLVFASFDTQVESLQDYLGPKILPWVDRVVAGRELTLLGYSRQRIPGNWKLMQENIKDPYHPGLLHTWFVTFGLWRADQQSQMVTDEKGRHAVMISRRNDGGAGDVTKGVSSFRENMDLGDDRLLDVVPEDWWDGPTVTMITVFPSLIIQQQVNSLSTRHIVPVGQGEFDFVWTHFGFSDDSAEMTQRRLRQANLFGPAGFVSADDGEVIELSQQGFMQDPENSTICELDGTGTGDADHMVTENADPLHVSLLAFGDAGMKLSPDQRADVDTLLAEYAAALDERRYQDWLELFSDEASYVLQPRENFDRQLPLATMRLESIGMMRDRIYGIENTLFHQPYYQRHVIGACRGVPPPGQVPGQTAPVDDSDGDFGAQANYAVFRTKVAGVSEVFNVGRYLIRLTKTAQGLKLRRVHVVFDSELVLNSMIYPI